MNFVLSGKFLLVLAALNTQSTLQMLVTGIVSSLTFLVSVEMCQEFELVTGWLADKQISDAAKSTDKSCCQMLKTNLFIIDIFACSCCVCMKGGTQRGCLTGFL